MNRKRLAILAAISAVLLGAGISLLAHRENQQSEQAGAVLFPDLKSSLDEVSEIRLSKGDGSRTTLRKQDGGWTVVERQFPADGARVRELLLGLVGMKVVESKTSDPANYAKLGVEAPDTATAASTLVEVVAGKKSWPLIVGRNAEGRALYVRKPADKASALVEPSIAVDPDQKRWIDRQLTDVRGDAVHDVSVRPASGPAYLLSRAKRGDTDLALSPVPKSRKPASSMAINGQADGLTALHFDDVRAVPATAPAAVDHATFRTFDGQVFELSGHKDADKAYISVSASRDAALAAQFPEPAAGKPAATPADAKAATPAATPAAAAAAAPAKPADQNAERVAARAKGLEFEIPLYKYESIFKPLEDLLEKKPEPAPKTAK
jgi:uncharacterized protein DUF4340